MNDDELEAVKAEAWERGFMYAFAQERGYGGKEAHEMPVPRYLEDDMWVWNPHIDYDGEGEE